MRFQTRHIDAREGNHGASDKMKGVLEHDLPDNAETVQFISMYDTHQTHDGPGFRSSDDADRNRDGEAGVGFAVSDLEIVGLPAANSMAGDSKAFVFLVI